MPYPYGALFRMLVLTGQRKSEVAEARWSEFDLVKKQWAIPRERMKADAAHMRSAHRRSDGDPQKPAALSAWRVSVLDYFRQIGGQWFQQGQGCARQGNGRRIGRRQGRAVRHPRHPPHHAHRPVGVAGTRSGPRVGDWTRQAGLAQGLRSARLSEREAPGARIVAGRLRDIVQPPPANVLKLQPAVL